MAPPPGAKIKIVRHNAPQIVDLHTQLITMTDGRDVSQLPGFTSLGFMKLIAETGTDLSLWRTVKHFTSWAGLAPGSNQSGKKRKRTRRKKTVAGQIFREAVLSLAKSKYLALGAAYRRLKARKGAAIAATAIARKLAELYYRLMTLGLDYVEKGAEAYEAKYKEQTLSYLKKKAATLGFSLTPSNPIIQSSSLVAKRREPMRLKRSRRISNLAAGRRGSSRRNRGAETTMPRVFNFKFFCIAARRIPSRCVTFIPLPSTRPGQLHLARQIPRRHRAARADTLSRAGGGDSGTLRREERHPEYAHRLGQIARRLGAAFQEPRAGRPLGLHLPHQGARE